MRCVRAALVMVIVLGVGGSGARADIDVDSWYLRTRARAGANPWGEILDTSFVSSQNVSSVPLGSTATTTYNFLNGSTATFNITMDHKRTTPFRSFGDSYGVIDFTVHEDMLYDISGWYELTGDKRLYLYTYLYEPAASSYLFRSLQESWYTSGESFVPGETGGDYANLLSGAPNGTLLAEHSYRFYYHYLVHAYPNAAAESATATGQITLSLNPVPVPGAAILGMIGIGMVGAYTRKRRLTHVTEA